MKFLADMGISSETVAFLQGLGYDAVHLHNQGLDRLQDSAILEKARNEGRVLLTHDLDFGELIAASGARLPSIVIFRLRNMRPERVNRNLHGIITQHQDSLDQGAILDMVKEKVELSQDIHFAEKEPLLLVAENGHEFILSQADDFEAEVEALRNSYEFQAFLDQRMKSQVRIPIEAIEREVEEELQGRSAE